MKIGQEIAIDIKSVTVTDEARLLRDANAASERLIEFYRSALDVNARDRAALVATIQSQEKHIESMKLDWHAQQNRVDEQTREINDLKNDRRAYKAECERLSQDNERMARYNREQTLKNTGRGAMNLFSSADLLDEIRRRFNVIESVNPFNEKSGSTK